MLLHSSPLSGRRTVRYYYGGGQSWRTNKSLHSLDDYSELQQRLEAVRFYDLLTMKPMRSAFSFLFIIIIIIILNTIIGAAPSATTATAPGEDNRHDNDDLRWLFDYNARCSFQATATVEMKRSNGSIVDRFHLPLAGTNIFVPLFMCKFCETKCNSSATFATVSMCSAFPSWHRNVCCC